MRKMILLNVENLLIQDASVKKRRKKKKLEKPTSQMLRSQEKTKKGDDITYNNLWTYKNISFVRICFYLFIVNY